MLLPMLADFAVRLAGGLAILLLLTPWRVVPPAFFRTQAQIILGLSVLAALDIVRAGLPSWVISAAVILALLAFATTIAWGLGLVRIGTPCSWALVVLSSVLLVSPSWPSLQAVELLNAASRLSSAFLLGATLTAMLLGHYYLTSPAMSIQPLVRFVRCMAVGLGLRLGLAVVALWLLKSGSTLEISPLFLAIRWGMGFAGPLVATVLAWKTVAIRSTQSATGILYIGVTLVLFGELTSLILARGAMGGRGILI